jgi:hypothetical protein
MGVKYSKSLKKVPNRLKSQKICNIFCPLPQPSFRSRTSPGRSGFVLEGYFDVISVGYGGGLYAKSDSMENHTCMIYFTFTGGQNWCILFFQVGKRFHKIRQCIFVYSIKNNTFTRPKKFVILFLWLRKVLKGCVYKKIRFTMFSDFVILTLKLRYGSVGNARFTRV